jgi:hypothetical protein
MKDFLQECLTDFKIIITFIRDNVNLRGLSQKQKKNYMFRLFEYRLNLTYS